MSVAQKASVAPALLIAICTVESTDLRNVVVENDKGTPSYGACQVKRDTAQFVGRVFKHDRLAKASDKDLRKDPHLNIKAAGLYLKYQLERYDGDWCKAVAAYNAGSFRESRKRPGKPLNYGYVAKVKKNLADDPSIEVLFSSCSRPVLLTSQPD